ncbi:hypothetical protein ACFLXU_07565 [Chloroflexota bacterium]
MTRTLSGDHQETINNGSSDAQVKFPHSWGEIIQYLDGMAYGIAPNGQTVCLGKEAEVKEMLADPLKHSTNTVKNDLIDLERQLTKQKEIENNGRQPELKKPGAFRSRTARTIKRRTANTRQTTARKRLSVH